MPNLNDDFLVLNGDTLTDLNFHDLLAAHQRTAAYGTIFSAKVEDFIDYGLVEFDPELGRLLRYIEKPTRHYHVSTGIYALSKRILQFADLPASLAPGYAGFAPPCRWGWSSDHLLSTGPHLLA